ncbi:hypothetical protein [Aeromicrobium stalagmiti]|uniref:hypothetical protein n=1 Tax=Aeromicrobium stalagmiti TaxID=2738988 RepID=UPI0015681413|nr:hypothetical protein [Aeromicrobium stalagmiti]NRQ48272.1 hypothetical protein [Aeromicrobium stalagmiti]
MSRPPRPVPAHLASRAFSRAEALAAGITPRMLQHPRFVEVHPSVYQLAEVELDDIGRIDAARRALPDDARVSHGTRLRLLGVERGPLEPMRFTVARDLHLDIPGIMLHRSRVLPPHDEMAVSVEAAMIGFASVARPIDVIVVGDWLLRRRHLDLVSLLALADQQSWRPGAAEIVEIAPLLDARSRSIPESETRVFLRVAGLPAPQVNHDVFDDGGSFLGCGDLVFLLWRLMVEYEGGQHFADPVQITSDVDRYAGLRAHDWAYVQVTKRHLAQPKSMVRRVHQALVARGYDGPAPQFGAAWDALFTVPPARRRPKVNSQRHTAA